MLVEFLAIIFLIILFGDFNLIEKFSTSPGTLQLNAKGTQDLYLTGYPPHSFPPFEDYSFKRLSSPSRNDLYYRKYHPYASSGWSILKQFPTFWDI